MPIHTLCADITTVHADAIVNAATPSLLGGGGVDGAIHHAAGAQLLAACRALPQSAPGIRCTTGEARLTPAFALPARWVIHTVGPIWRGGDAHEAEMLERCYRNACRLLREHGGRSIVFPAISCGVYGYPASPAAAIASATLCDELQRDASLDITLCCFNAGMQTIVQGAVDVAVAAASHTR
ncbi:MAG: macro domain-containing protein [Rhodanobacter sp.]